MENVLLISASDKSQALLSGLIRDAFPAQVSAAMSGIEGRRMIAAGDYSLILINTPLREEFGHELALMAAGQTDAGVLLIAGEDMADSVAAALEDGGVLVVHKPLHRALFAQALRLARAASRRMTGLKNQNVQLQRKIDEIRIVERAKHALIQVLNMTEPQAHRYIEKQAMDRRVQRREVAEGILKTYEL